jgi:putative restriction endonuclease
MADLFESLGAPLKNRRWSWGARRHKDGAIFLRAWKDELFTDSDGHECVQIAWESGAYGPGWKERQEHIASIRSGAQCLLVMCEAVDESAVPRKVAAFDPRTVLVGGEIKLGLGVTLIRVVQVRSVWEVR